MKRPRLGRHQLVDALAEALAEQHAAATDAALCGLAHSIAGRLMARYAGARIPRADPDGDARDAAIRAALESSTFAEVAERFGLAKGTLCVIAKRC